jgi:hypothetical protein
MDDHGLISRRRIVAKPRNRHHMAVSQMQSLGCGGIGDERLGDRA